MAFAVVAVVAVAVNPASDFGRDWTPNVATEALSLLLTIAVVDRVIRRANEQRLAPRVNRALTHMEAALTRFM